MKVNVKVTGTGAIIKNITQYSTQAQSKVKDVVNRSALNIQNGAKRRTPVDTGRLRSSIAIEPQSELPYVVRVGTNVQYALGVEFGTSPHIIKPKNKKALFWKGANHPVKSVKHPGTKAQPFLFPSWEEERPNFLKEIEGALKK